MMSDTDDQPGAGAPALTGFADWTPVKLPEVGGIIETRSRSGKKQSLICVEVRPTGTAKRKRGKAKAGS
jgi:hypothetical protein